MFHYRGANSLINTDHCVHMDNFLLFQSKIIFVVFPINHSTVDANQVSLYIALIHSIYIRIFIWYQCKSFVHYSSENNKNNKNWLTKKCKIIKNQQSFGQVSSFLVFVRFKHQIFSFLFLGISRSRAQIRYIPNRLSTACLRLESYLAFALYCSS